ALRWLEGLLAQTPRAGDAVASWLNPSLAAHIEQAGLFTLAQLIDHINGIGKLWHGSIPALGTAKAGLVVAWLGEHQASLGRAVGRHIVRARTALLRSELDAVVAPASDIRPLEKFIVPAELDGRHGAYRRPQAQCLLKASNDHQAILAWIQSKHGLTLEQKLALRAGRRHP
ncbi:MAG: integrase, partial [Burkholderiales bacterium]|nr:integrase [Burkholderiales bacterium]